MNPSQQDGYWIAYGLSGMAPGTAWIWTSTPGSNGPAWVLYNVGDPTQVSYVNGRGVSLPNGSVPISYGGYNFGSIDAAFVVGVPGSPVAGQRASSAGYYSASLAQRSAPGQATGGTNPSVALVAQGQQTGPVFGAPAGPAAPGYVQGPRAGVSTALVAQLLTGQQAAAASAAIMGQGATDVAAAATADDLSAGMLSIISGVAMSVGISASNGQSSLISSPNGILFALLGAQGVTNLAAVIVDASKVLDLASTTTAGLSGAAWDKFVGDVSSVLSQVQTNQLLGSLAGGNVGTGALLGILMGQQALATFAAQSKTGTSSTTVATAQANVSKFVSAFGALMAAMNTNQLLLALVPS